MHELIDHPCVQHKLAIIRDVDTGHKRFRELATEITKFICYEALKNIEVKEVTVQTPVAEAICKKIDTALVVVTILLAGIGLLAALRQVGRSKRTIFSLRSWVPLAGGATLLVFLGSSGEQTDILGHVLGFGSGVAAGWVLARWDRDWSVEGPAVGLNLFAGHDVEELKRRQAD